MHSLLLGGQKPGGDFHANGNEVRHGTHLSTSIETTDQTPPHTSELQTVFNALLLKVHPLLASITLQPIFLQLLHNSPIPHCGSKQMLVKRTKASVCICIIQL